MRSVAEAAVMSRRPNRVNVAWLTPLDDFTWQHVTVEVLQDIRAELRAIRARLDCPEVLAVPRTLRSIRKALYPSSRKAKAAS